jgi:type I restriction enzyme R subunit
LLIQRNKQGVIWHTQGSGKSFTMLYTAYKLRNEPDLKDPTVYIIVDRKDLKEQLGGTFDDCEFPNASTIISIAELKSKIKNKPAGVFITTVQKFNELGDVLDDRNNVIVLIDEAHRTQYGDYQTELQAVLPNAYRFAFTGTPIPKTHQEFGIVEERKLIEPYLDQYSIKDSVEDGATKKVRYTFGPQEWFLDKKKLKKGWEEITADLTEDQKKKVQYRVQPWKTFLKKKERIEILAKDIAEDFNQVVEPNGFKAQVVACDKEACVLYYDELLKYFDSSEISIVFSSSAYMDVSGDPDDEITIQKKALYRKFKDYELEDGERKKIIKKFKKELTEEEKKNGNNLKILIVCNMLLTGFDAPIEQCMYLDSPLRDHNLLQAIARTNRPYENKITKIAKEFGRVVDYVGVFENYNEALNYDPADIGEFEDVDSLVEDFPDVLGKAMKPFDKIELVDTYECSIEIVRVLSKIDHGRFEDSVKNVIQLYEAVSPHPKLRDHLLLFKWLIAIYEIYMEEFIREDFDAEFYAAKTRRLIHQSTRILNFKGHLPEIEIDSNYINRLNDSKLNPSDKAEKIIRDIETVIRQNELESPIYVEFQNKLDDLIKKKENESLSIEDMLIELESLFGELDNVATLPRRMGFKDRGSFDIYAEIKNEVDSDNEELIKMFAKDVVDKVIKEKIYIGWQDNSREKERLKTDIEIFALSDNYEELNIAESEELMKKIMNRVEQHYHIEK